MRSVNTIVLGLALSFSSVAFAGRGATTVGIEAAIASGSADTIVAELERAEILACLACIDPIRKLTDYPSARVRDAAGWWLGEIGVNASGVANALQAAANDSDAGVRSIAAGALGRLK